MSWQSILMFAVVAGVGIPAAFRFTWPPEIRNVTALALVAAWLIAEVIVYRTGNSLPFGLYFKADMAVIFVIYAKAIHRCGAKLYSSLGEQMRCMATDLTWWDRFIVAIYLFGAWPLYIIAGEPWWKWQALMWLAIAQFLLAGGEALTSFIASRRKAVSDTPIIDRHFTVIPFPVQRRVADAVRSQPEPSGALLIVEGSRGYG